MAANSNGVVLGVAISLLREEAISFSFLQLVVKKSGRRKKTKIENFKFIAKKVKVNWM